MRVMKQTGSESGWGDAAEKGRIVINSRYLGLHKNKQHKKKQKQQILPH